MLTFRAAAGYLHAAMPYVNFFCIAAAVLWYQATQIKMEHATSGAHGLEAARRLQSQTADCSCYAGYYARTLGTTSVCVR